MQFKYSKNTKLITLFFTILTFTTLLTGGNYSKNYIKIVDSNDVKMIFSKDTDPLVILNKENIILSPYDTYYLSDFENDMAVLEIIRASKILINVDDNTYTIYQSMKTVKEAIDQANIILNPNDIVNIPLDKIITNDTTITITRVTTRILEVNDTLNFDTILQPTNTLKDGEYRILQQGVDGYIKSTTFQRLHDDIVISEEILSHDKLEPVNEIRLVGDSSAISSKIIPDSQISLDDNGNPTNYIQKYTGKATAYSALGKPTNLIPGDVAMNLDLVPRGSKVYVKTPDNSYIYGYGEVSDTGTALVENIILVDLFFDSYLESCLFGAKEIEVYVLE